MAKVQILGPRRLLPDVLGALQGLGVLELREGGSLQAVSDSAAEERAAALVETVRRIEATAALLARATPRAVRRRRSGRLALASAAALAPATLPDPEDAALAAVLGRLDDEHTALDTRRAALAAEADLLDRHEAVLVALAPLRPALPGGEPAESFALVLKRSEPDGPDLLRRAVQPLCGDAVEVLVRPLDASRTAALLTVPRAHARDVEALLFARGVERVVLPAPYAGGSVLELLSTAVRRRREIPAEVAVVESAAAALADRWARALGVARAEARARLGRLQAQARCGETAHAFVVSGWAPAVRMPELRAEIAARFGHAVEVLDYPIAPEELERVPVVLHNPRALRPFELLLSLVPLPRYGSIDPTPFVAVFFPLLFGFIVGDAAFGLLALGVAILARARGWGGETGRRVAWIAIACAASTTVFGLLFGEALGALGEAIGLRPLLFDRRSAIVPFVATALGAGVLHVTVGMVLGVAHAVRARHVREAVARAARLVLFPVAGVGAAALAGRLPGSAVYVAAITGGALLLVLLVTGGPMALLELVLTAGNVLSYARLMALGLAAAMLAEVANRVAVTVKPAALGVGIAVLVHAANFATALLSPTIAALRLNYVEFFEKFYEGGGRPYRPFEIGA